MIFYQKETEKNGVSGQTCCFAEGESWKGVGPEMPVANRPIVNVHHKLEVRDLVLLLNGSQEEVLHALTPGWWKQGLGTNSISLSWLFKFKDRSEKVRF